jgi:hypothetical protein
MREPITQQRAIATLEKLRELGLDAVTVEDAERQFGETVKWARMFWRNKRTRRCNAQYPAFIMGKLAASAWAVRWARAFATVSA